MVHDSDVARHLLATTALAVFGTVTVYSYGFTGLIALYATLTLGALAYRVTRPQRTRYMWRHRSKAGTSTNLDANDLIYDRWGPRHRSDWDDTNGRVPYTHALHILNPICTPPSPTVITRWIYANEEPSVLVLFVRAGFTDDEITNYMGASAEDRAATQVVAHLAAGSETR